MAFLYRTAVFPKTNKQNQYSSFKSLLLFLIGHQKLMDNINDYKATININPHAYLFVRLSAGIMPVLKGGLGAPIVPELVWQTLLFMCRAKVHFECLKTGIQKKPKSFSCSSVKKIHPFLDRAELPSTFEKVQLQFFSSCKISAVIGVILLPSSSSNSLWLPNCKPLKQAGDFRTHRISNVMIQL